MRPFVLLVVFVAVVFCQPANDKIDYLPGLTPQPSFAQYSGYINVTNGQMFYWFVESQGIPSADPVVLWLNGGPGCSSLAGLLSENGPFTATPNVTLKSNPNSWNKIANVLYLESAPGVGFSINHADFLYYTDNRTAETNYEFLQGWFKSFSSYQKNEFWITGESYAGHYIPTLVDKILSQNSNTSNIHLNLQGFAVGNPSTDFTNDDGALYDAYFPSHGLSCLDKKYNRPGQYGIIDPYDIIADVCYQVALVDRVRFPNPFVDALRASREARTRERDVPPRPACIGDYVQDYLNDATVQKALHVAPRVWNQCGGPPYRFGQESLVPYYAQFLATSSLRIMVYSGDEDTVIPFMGTEEWVLSLKQVNQSYWGPWYSSWSGTNQVAGYWINFGNIWYATVKGAGHMVPWFQPGAAYDMFQRFITNTPLGTY